MEILNRKIAKTNLQQEFCKRKLYRKLATGNLQQEICNRKSATGNLQ
jgi:hypothetical protein